MGDLEKNGDDIDFPSELVACCFSWANSSRALEVSGWRQPSQRGQIDVFPEGMPLLKHSMKGCQEISFLSSVPFCLGYFGTMCGFHPKKDGKQETTTNSTLVFIVWQQCTNL